MSDSALAKKASPMIETAVSAPEANARPAERSDSAQPSNRDDRLGLLLAAQNDVLEGMARGSQLADTLHVVAAAVEAMVPSALCAVVLFDERNRGIEFTVAPSLSGDFTRSLERVRLSDCDSAPELDDAVPAPAPFCRALREQRPAPGLELGSLEAIRNENNPSMGLVALYTGQGRELDDGERRAVQAMIPLARFAIEFDRRNTALQSANDRFASLASAIPGVVYQRIVEPDGSMHYSYISEGARDIFGVAPQEIIADPRALFDTHGPEYAATFRERLLTASRDLTMWDVEATIITRDGRRKFTHAIARPTRRPDGSVQWDGIILDATRIKEAELAAAAAEARTRDTIVESIPHGFVLFDPDDRVSTWNNKFLDFYPRLDEVMVPGVAYRTIIEAEVQHGLDVENLSTLGEEEEPPTPEQRIASRMAQHARSSHSIERRLSDGRWILINEERTADGGTVILHTDVTELKDREAALERSNRELQDFASVASHDLQEPLRKIEAFGDRLKAKYGSDLGDDGQMYIDRMQNAAGRMRSLINDLLSYSRVTTKARPFVEVDLDKCANEVLSDLQVAIESSSAKIELENLPVIEADALQMRMLLQNLISNAIKFQRPDETPKITLAARIVGPASSASGADDESKQVCELSVADNGIGFEMKYASRIFGIFQRLHGRNEYEGTGVGLATCRKIVERHNGTIQVESAPGQGTTFTMQLPLKHSAAGAK